MKSATRAAIALIILLTAPQAVAKTVSYAIVIGNNEPPKEGPGQDLPSLQYADDDAVRYFQLFARLSKEATLLSVLDDRSQQRYPALVARAMSPTLQNLRQVVGRLQKKMQADRRRGDEPVLYFAFSGHGSKNRDGSAFLALLDGELTQQILYDEVLSALPTTYSHVIIDACHASDVVGVRGPFFDRELEAQTERVSPSEMEPILESRSLTRRLPQVGVILATTSGQQAHEWSAIESGVFTHELLSGLLGPADINGDRKIEYTEAEAFIASANRNIRDPKAIPVIVARPPALNRGAPLLSLSDLGGMQTLEGNAAGLGHFFVELQNGQRYLDAHMSSGASTVIALPANVVAFVRNQTHEARLRVQQTVRLETLALRKRTDVRARGSIEDTYRQALFSAPYGKDYYRGYVDSRGLGGVQFSQPTVSTSHPVRKSSAQRNLAIGLIVGGAAAASASVVTGIAAYEAKRDYDETDLQRSAERFKDRYYRDVGLALGTGVAAGLLGLAAWWIWPDHDESIQLGGAPGGATGLSALVRW